LKYKIDICTFVLTFNSNLNEVLSVVTTKPRQSNKDNNITILNQTRERFLLVFLRWVWAIDVAFIHSVGSRMAVGTKELVQVGEARGIVAAEAGVVCRVEGNASIEGHPVSQTLVACEMRKKVVNHRARRRNVPGIR
jgi:hypothetical protein